ncbi:MAG: hypothetical protein WBF50_06590 [Pseudolabrys sp.]
MAKLFLVLATIADLALAALLVGVSGFMFGGVWWLRSPDLFSIVGVKPVSG